MEGFVQFKDDMLCLRIHSAINDPISFLPWKNNYVHQVNTFFLKMQLNNFTILYEQNTTNPLKDEEH